MIIINIILFFRYYGGYVFTKQIMMRRMLFSLIPVFFFASYLYGWRVAALAAVVFTSGILTEYFFEKRQNKKVSEAVLVTCALYTLSLPPAVPFWIAAIGIIFAVFFAKEVYGGFGRNIFNPAIAGRLFIYISFPSVMTGGWMVPGNFGTIDAVTSATPLETLKAGGSLDLNNLITGIHPGSLGESAVILILAAAVYLIATKTANWKIMFSVLVSAAVTSAAIGFLDSSLNINVLQYMLSGSILFVAVFIATDPVTAPKKPASVWIYGMIIGFTAIIVRTYSLFPEGTSFGILLGNTFAPLIDKIFTKVKKAKA
ncbi:MAG: RnfABCDGE type electron transport complex subunit D [Spirochaetes bacterium]|nr:RnfABCDGE type electron transport complex subunit D [Spirochaetota bacterium]